MRLRRHAKHTGESHGIDLAPMLDFVLNLLIFFIITAVFVRELGLSVNRPQGDVNTTPPKDGAGTIPISITATGEIYVDNRVVDLRAVRPNVERLFAVNPKSGVLIVTDKDAETGVLTQVVDQVHLGGIYNITFSTAN
jgi:biopolymer transport protein ExbD